VQSETSSSEKLVVVTGPSGVGKSTIVREVLRRTGVRFSVSATTRAPRKGEVDGRDYHFVDGETFREKIRRGDMLEWAEVFGELYGTPAEPVRRALRDGETVVLDIDTQGSRQVRTAMPDAIFVLIVPPDESTLRTRLDRRGTESDRSLRQRLGAAGKEVQTARNSGAYQYTVVNDDLESAVRQVVEIVTEEPCHR